MNRYSATLVIEILSSLDESSVQGQAEALTKEVLLGLTNNHIGIVGAHVISVQAVEEQKATMKAIMKGANDE